jgi:hypothetical protein
MRHGTATILAVCSAVAGVILLAVLRINPASQNLPRTIAGITWPLLLLVGYFLYYVVQAPWKIHQQDIHAIDALRHAISTAIGKSSTIEIVGAFELLSREAKQLALTLWGMRQEAGKETDPEEFPVVNTPLDSSTLDLQGRSKWRLMHYRIWRFQQNYVEHWEKVAFERLDTGFTSFVMKHPINKKEPSTSKEVIDGLNSHAQELQDYAARLRGEFKASATISPAAQT